MVKYINMEKNLLTDYIYPVATIAGSIIGVGFFSLPYIATKVGVVIMSAYFIFILLIVILIHQVFGQISLKTPDYKRFPGFVNFYLGRRVGFLALLSMIFGSFGVMLVYLVIGSDFLFKALSLYFGGEKLFYLLIYFIISSLIIYFGTKAVFKIELLAIVLLLLSFLFIFVKGVGQINLQNFQLIPFEFNVKDIFLPYGALLFSLWGTGLIPEAEEMLKSKKDIFKKVIFIATLIPAIIYLLFIFLVVGISGQNTTESALSGLRFYLGDRVVIMLLLIGMATTFSAFVATGLNLKKLFIYDLKIKEKFAFIFTVFPPLILLLLGLNSFMSIISFIGGVLLGIDGILILLMYKKIGGRNFVIYPLGIVFVLGIVYNIIYFIK